MATSAIEGNVSCGRAPRRARLRTASQVVGTRSRTNRESVSTVTSEAMTVPAPQDRSSRVGTLSSSPPSTRRWPPSTTGAATPGSDELAVTAQSSEPLRCTAGRAVVRLLETQ